MKKFRKLIPALAMLLVSAVLMSTASYAWFSMNTKVTATGMEVTVKVSDNLLIADSSAVASTATAGEAAFKTYVNESVAAVIEPVSTINGINFFYNKANNTGANGARIDNTINYIAYNEATALSNDAAKKTNKDQAFNEEYGFTGADTSHVCYGYVDYVFELKAANTTSNPKYINLTKLDLVSSNATITEKAFRVAMFVQDGTVDGNNVVTSYAAFPATAKTILAPNSATLHNNTAVSAVDTKAAVVNAGVATSLTVAANKTAYYKVTFRLYVEGEDTTCTNSTFMTLSNAWNLDVLFTLEDSTSETKSLQELKIYKALTVNLNTVATKIYYDGTDLYKVADMTKLNSVAANKIPTSVLTADELTALNAALGGTSFTRADS